MKFIKIRKVNKIMISWAEKDCSVHTEKSAAKLSPQLNFETENFWNHEKWLWSVNCECEVWNSQCKCESRNTNAQFWKKLAKETFLLTEIS